MSLAWLIWNPNRIAFHIPYFHHPIAWYGLLFAAGFFFAYWIVFYLLKKETDASKAQTLADRLTFVIVLATIIGARLGFVFFYNPFYYFSNPLQIFKIWEGGLASHGGAIAILLSLFFLSKKINKEYPSLPKYILFDVTALVTPLVGAFIRVGNFVNQEIVGNPTDLRWAVIFLQPLEAVPLLPRHPVQLYEALAYFLTFCLLYTFWITKKVKYPPLWITGWSLTLIFLSRILLEPFKVPQSEFLKDSILSYGQLLSLPFLFLGLAIIVATRRSSHPQR